MSPVDLRAVKCECYGELRSGKTIGPARRLKYISGACSHRSRRRRDAGDNVLTENASAPISRSPEEQLPMVSNERKYKTVLLLEAQIFNGERPNCEMCIEMEVFSFQYEHSTHDS